MQPQDLWRKQREIGWSLPRGAQRWEQKMREMGVRWPTSGPAQVWLGAMMDIAELGPLGYIRKAAFEAAEGIDYAISTGKVPNPDEMVGKAVTLLERAVYGPQEDARKAKDALQRLRARALGYTRR